MVVLCLQNNIGSIHILIKSLLSRNTYFKNNKDEKCELRTVSVMKLNFIPSHWLLVVKLPSRPAMPNGQNCPSLTDFIAPFPCPAHIGSAGHR